MDILSPQTPFGLLVSAALLTLPGTTLYLLALRLLDRTPTCSLPSALLIGSGLSIAFWPLLLLYSSLIGLAFSPILLWAILLLCAAYIAHRIISTPASLPTRAALWTALSLSALTLLSLAFRLNDIQGIDVPLFGDSLHHTMITRMIMDSGRLPTGYLPYVPVDTFTYHFGFHTLSAILGQLASLDPEHAVLLMGQVLITLAVPLSYLFARHLFNSPIAGLGAALLTGFVSIMPSFYVNWGRYTQLAGNLLVVIAIIMTVRLMSARWKRSDFALTAFCVAGLMVVHYRVLIFFGLFGLALGAYQLFALRARWRDLLPRWTRGLLAVLAGLAFTFPWLYNVASNYFPGLSRRLQTVTPDYLAGYNNPDAIRLFAGLVLPTLALLAIILSLISLRTQRTSPHRQRDDLTTNGALVVLVLWILALIGSLWPVPGAIGAYAVAISLYLPLSALGGYALALLAHFLQLRPTLKLPEPALPLAILAAAPILSLLLGTWHVSDPGTYSSVHDPDRAAFAWINANTPPNARFLIASTFSYAGRGLTGSDAGMWLPLLADRNVSVPALSAWQEHPIDPNYFIDTRALAAYTQPIGTPGQPGDSLQVNLLSRNVITTTGNLSSPQPLALMQKLGITNVYSSVKAGNSHPRLDVEALRRDTDHYHLLYFKDGVYIFEISY